MACAPKALGFIPFWPLSRKEKEKTLRTLRLCGE